MGNGETRTRTTYGLFNTYDQTLIDLAASEHSLPPGLVRPPSFTSMASIGNRYNTEDERQRSDSFPHQQDNGRIREDTAQITAQMKRFQEGLAHATDSRSFIRQALRSADRDGKSILESIPYDPGLDEEEDALAVAMGYEVVNLDDPSLADERHT